MKSLYFIGRYIVAISFICVFLISFQNCSAPVGNDTDAAQSQSPSPALNDNGQALDEGSLYTSSFQAGEPFSYGRMVTKQMIAELVLHLNYNAYENGKAIAINAKGLGFVSIKSSGEVDAIRTALQSCYVIGGGLPCALLAAGDSFRLSSDDLDDPSVFSYQLERGTELVASAIPFLRTTHAEELLDLYNEELEPKAMAISVEGTRVIASPTTNGNITSTEEASRLAMERCELLSILSPCLLLAVNNELVFDPNARLVSMINYDQNTIQDSIPGTRDSVFTENIINTHLARLAEDPLLMGSIYISGNGQGGSARRPTQAEADQVAQENCQAVVDANVDAGGPDSDRAVCFKYAEGTNVLPVHENLFSYREHQVLHCQVVPRQSCEAHFAVGCARGGSYYVYGDDGVDITVCE